ncbi:MAG: hypothetical protein U9R79_01465 [Armatimonadota bacterium]|nr:hypothetical protein [Armatimonadota bacterium]
MTTLLAFVLLTPAGAWAQDEGGRETSVTLPEIEEADQPIVEAFLRHVDSSAAYCTPERMARFAAQPEDITWQTSRHIRMPLVAFRLTGESRYLDEFVTRLEALLAEMSRDEEGHPGWYGLALELFRHPEHPDEPVDVIITSFTMAELMAEFAIVVREAGLAERYAEQIGRYLELAQKLVDKWEERGNYREIGERGAVYITHERLKPVKGHLTEPHNKHEMITRALVNLYAATGEAGYIEKAVRLGTRFKRCLMLDEQGIYRWNYWDPAGEWDVHPEEPGRWKHWIGAEHRGGYYSLSLSQTVLLYELGLVFDDRDIERFVRTQTEVAWNGSYEDPQWFRVDGREADEGHVYLCRWLASYDERIHEMAFGAHARSVRMEARDHPWQGGVVAMSWLEDKYLILPRWESPGASDAALVGEWAAGEGAELLAELAFDVEPPGYEPPMSPSQAAWLD